MQCKLKILMFFCVIIIGFGCNKVYGMEVDSQNVRYISEKYIDTLSKKSKWNGKLKTKLRISLQKEEGNGIYTINMSNSQIKQIKQSVRDNRYIINQAMNIALVESW